MESEDAVRMVVTSFPNFKYGNSSNNKKVGVENAKS